MLGPADGLRLGGLRLSNESAGRWLADCRKAVETAARSRPARLLPTTFQPAEVFEADQERIEGSRFDLELIDEIKPMNLPCPRLFTQRGGAFVGPAELSRPWRKTPQRRL